MVFSLWGSNRNVLQDEAGHLKVTDFGLSKIGEERDEHGYKMTGGTGSCKMKYYGTFALGCLEYS